MQEEIADSVFVLKRLCRSLGFCFIGATSIGRSFAETATLHPVADTSLFENFPDNNLGQNPNLVSGANGSGLRGRTLFRFDIAGQIPSNAAIQSVALNLIVVIVPAGGGEPSIYDLRRMLVSWEEGTGAGNGGAAANTGESTWNNRFHPSTSWTVPGGAVSNDFSQTASASLLITNLGAFTFTSTTNLVEDVQEWLRNPAGNFGWMLISQSEDIAFTAKRFGSREDTNNWPALVVHYSLPIAPEIQSIQSTGNQFQFSFLASAGQPYTVQYCASLNSGSWLTLTNIVSQTAITNVIISDTLSNNTQRFYRVGVF